MKKPHRYYIYLLRNPWKEPKYVGQTDDPKRRQGEHGIRFQDPMTMEILQGCPTRDEANRQERFYIWKYDTYHNGYNRNEGGGYFTHDEKIASERRAKKQAAAEKARLTRRQNVKPTYAGQNTLD